MKLYTIIFSLMIGSPAISQNEKHLKNLKMLTHGGDNAEAYFSYDNKNASFQSNNSKWGLKCDQIFNLDINKAEKDSTYKPKMISSGKGRTTCSYFLKDNKVDLLIIMVPGIYPDEVVKYVLNMKLEIDIIKLKDNKIIPLN